ncbi:Na+/H+ antiporter subunit D [Corynebacterium choanae]|uniref:Na(+)/H(+) antiporter subunit D n=1 Tax=Corynebacterium choanae TaxID=1862358 RepID=A0A3G6J4R5_9CORY|nr:Na+/H+ antiporter subunit D [Corynebacterium choanae]AZA12723.1 Na(+)/H(+) antiporter subunit D [Corynebacterium choanae]
MSPTLAATIMPYLIALPVILPAAAAGGCLLLARFTRTARILATVALTATIAICFSMIAATDLIGITTLQLGGWDAPVGITLVADRLSTLMLAVSSLVILTVMWYAIGQTGHGSGRNTPNEVFLPAYLLLTMGVNIAFLSGDLFHLYVGFEVLLVSSYVLLTIGASPARVRAGVSYVMVSTLSSLIFVIGIGLVYAAVGTMNLAQISQRMELVPTGTKTAIFAVLLVAFGIKAAIFPLYSWLPDSYPTAPVLVSAVFAGLLTKVGVYSIIRLRFVVFPDGSLDTVLLWAAIFTMVVGILGAMAQNDIKRLLSFTLVSHIGYMLIGVACATAVGLAGAIFYTVHHIVVQTALFLVVGLIEAQAGTSSLRKLGSLAYLSPLVGLLYLVPALNLGGIPPLSGFLGKVIILQALAAKGGAVAFIGIAAAVVTSLLTLYTMTLVWQKAFWRDRADAPDYHPLHKPAAANPAHSTAHQTTLKPLKVGTVVPTAVMVAASVAITVMAGPLSAVTGRSAESAQDVGNYRAAVLGEDYLRPSRSETLPTIDDDPSTPQEPRPDDKTSRGDGIVHDSTTPQPTPPQATTTQPAITQPAITQPATPTSSGVPAVPTSSEEMR